MTAALDAIMAIRPPAKFFDALAQADAHLAKHQDLEVAASFAPPVRSAGHCVCGSVIECRDNQLDVTAEETAAAVGAVADLLGSGAPAGLAALIVDRVIDAINQHRADDDHDAMRDWADVHADCGGDE